MITAEELAKLAGGTVIGNKETKIKGIARFSFLEKGDMTFAVNEEELDKAAKSKASCVVTTLCVKDYPKTVLVVKDLKLAMTIFYNAFLEIKPEVTGERHFSSIVAETAKLGRNVSIGPNSTIRDNVEIGDNTSIGANCVIGKNGIIGKDCQFFPNVTLYEGVIIGNKVILHSGTVIGSDGFGYMPYNGKIYKVPQLGTVIIEDEVEIGANTSVDRGTFTDTVIGKGSKIDNQVQIAHNVKIGKNVLIAAQVGIAGSSQIGECTMIGGQAGVSDHISVGKNVKIGAATGVIGSVKDNAVVFGYPSRDLNEAKRLYGLLSLLLRNYIKIIKFLKQIPEEL